MVPPWCIYYFWSKHKETNTKQNKQPKPNIPQCLQFRFPEVFVFFVFLVLLVVVGGLLGVWVWNRCLLYSMLVGFDLAFFAFAKNKRESKRQHQ